jgi:ABC-type nitrate/sulfonate/bicarbonate transport system substrate-binding protein
MRTEAFWVMDDDDESLAADLGLGLGAEPARVLAYLLRREDDDRIEDPRARVIEIRLGTGLGRQPVIDALSALAEHGLVAESTLDSQQGRPPKAWSSEGTVETAMRRAYGERADRLVSALPADAATGPATDPSGEPLRVGFNWLPNGLQVPFYAARAADTYEAARLDVEFVHHRGSQASLDAVAAGAVDVGVVGAATLTSAIQRGVSIEPLAVLYQRAMAVLYTTRAAFGGPLTESEQLRGRRIGLSPNTETRLLAEVFLSQAGVGDDVEIFEPDGEEAEALRSGRADVVAGSFSDPWRLDDGADVETLAIAEQFPIYGPVLAVDPGAVAPARLRRFLTATMLGWRAGRADPTPAAGRIAAESDADRDEVERTFRTALSSFADSKASRTEGWGVHREDDWERLRIALARTGRLGAA